MSYSAFSGAGTGNYGVLWNNGVVQYFGPGQLQSVNAAAIPGTAGVAVVGNDIYVSDIIPDDTYAGGYWENGTFNSINNGEFHPLAMLASATTFIFRAMPTQVWPYVMQYRGRLLEGWNTH